MIRPSRSKTFRLIPATLAMTMISLAAIGCSGPAIDAPAVAHKPPSKSHPTVVGTATAPQAGPFFGPPTHTITAEPVLRVRMVAGAARVTVQSDAPLVLAPSVNAAPSARHRFAAPIAITRQGRAFIVQHPQGTVSWVVPTLLVEPSAGHTLAVAGKTLPGRLSVVPQRDPSRLDAVSHVPLEQYLPGVLANELYGSWSAAAYEAQAIAARSYALWERARYPSRHYDIEATTAGQVYGGESRNPKAVQAAQRTRGQVLVWDGCVLPAFYSSSCGRVGQDAVAAFPGVAPDLPPLRGGPRGTWDDASPHASWGPIYRDRGELARRLAAWGRQNRHAIANLNGIGNIVVSRLSRSGRPAAFAVTDTAGTRYELAAEAFRFACNTEAVGVGELVRDRQLRSSHVQFRVEPHHVVFHGQGYGHGAGMSQWGAQAMAAAGHRAPAILAFYYPGARIQKLY